MFIEQPTEEEIQEWINTDAYKVMNAIKEHTLVYSLTTNYNNAPMWSTYANDYNGITISNGTFRD